MTVVVTGAKEHTWQHPVKKKSSQICTPPPPKIYFQVKRKKETDCWLKVIVSHEESFYWCCWMMCHENNAYIHVQVVSSGYGTAELQFWEGNRIIASKKCTKNNTWKTRLITKTAGYNSHISYPIPNLNDVAESVTIPSAIRCYTEHITCVTNTLFFLLTSICAFGSFYPLGGVLSKILK